MRMILLINFILIGQIAIASGAAQSPSDIDRAQYEIREFVRDGVWTWFNDERVIIDNQILYMGSIDSQGQSRVNLFPLMNSSENLLEQEYNSRDIKEYR